MRIFHIALAADWAATRANGSYTVSTLGVTLEQEGFIHCSRREQVEAVRERFYRGLDEPLLLLEIDTDQLDSPWQLDPLPETGEEFPHIYGPLNLDAVVDTRRIV
ncbi:MAG TPA: DUF952 domain-containing protein [Nocardioidaceae bacterium]|nr:DUF952 domain-containing protein [Nocardioidaceae bacterium]